MPHKDPERRRQATREAVRRHRARKADAIAEQLRGVLPDPPTRDELLRMLGVMAGLGSVAAIRILLEEYRRDADRPAPDVFSEFDDEFSKRRGRPRTPA